MKLFDTIAISTLTGLICIKGYYMENDAKKEEEDLKRFETIIGYPISLEHEGNYGRNSLSVMVRNKDGRNILCQGKSRSAEDLPIAKVSSLIRSEMNDGDNESIELKGVYRGDIFEIWSVSANCYTVSKNNFPLR